MKASVARMQVFPTCRATTLQLAVTHPPRQQPPGPKTPSLIKPIIPFHQSKRLPREGRFLPAPPTNAGGPLGSLGTTSDDEQQPRPTILGHRFRFEDIYWYINAAYWSTLLLSILTDNKWLDAAAHFGNFVSAMTIASFFFTGWCAINWVLDVRRHLANSERKKRDAQGVLRYGWRALFWLGFVLWYAIDPVDAVVEWSATPGAIMCTYGLALAASSALQIGSVRQRAASPTLNHFLLFFCYLEETPFQTFLLPIHAWPFSASYREVITSISFLSSVSCSGLSLVNPKSRGACRPQDHTRSSATPKLLGICSSSSVSPQQAVL